MSGPEPGRGCLYFLPRRAALGRRALEEAGLGYLLDGRGGPGPTHAALESGPEGQSGVVFTVAGRRGRGGHDRPQELAREARWSRVPDSPAWLGIVEGARPGPVDLARWEQFAGHEVELGDGASWRVPVVRLLTGTPGLPRALEWDGRDWRHGDVRPTYRALWAAATRFWDSLVEQLDSGAITLNEEATTASAALALNYRIGPAEVSALGLLDTRSEVAVLKALIDLPALEAIRGKAVAATPS